MKKLLAVVLVMCMVLSLTGCGSSKAIWGVYEGSTIRMLGEDMPFTKVYDGVNELRLEKGKKGTLVLEGDAYPISWKIRDEKLTVTVDGEKSHGTIQNDVITLNFMNMGVNMVFVKQGKVALKDKPEQMPAVTESPVVGEKDGMGASLFDKIGSAAGKEQDKEAAEREEPAGAQTESTAKPASTPKPGAEATAEPTASPELTAEAAKPLTLKTEPAGVTAKEGDTVSFKVEAEGGKKPYTYQWSYRNTSLIGYKQMQNNDENKGVATDTLSVTLSSNHFNHKYEYRCIVTDAEGNSVTSEVAGLTLKTKPLTIRKEPSDVTAAEGDTAIFRVEAEGGKEPYTYQWSYKNTSLMGYKQMQNSIENDGVTTDTLKVTLSADHFNHKYEYRCIVTDADGNSVTSKVAGLKLEATDPLTITQQPKDVECKQDERVKFKVAVTGGAKPYTYKWQVYKDDVGSWGDSDQKGDTIDAIAYRFAFDNHWKFRCVVTDARGNQVTSDTATLVEKVSALQVEIDPDKLTVGQGDQGTVRVYTAGGVQPLSYQWQFSINKSIWKDIPDGASDTLTITGSSNQNGVYLRCIVTDAKGNSQTTGYCRIKVENNLRFEDEPNDVTIHAGDTATLSAKVAGGTEPYSVEWQYKQGGRWYTANAYGMQYYIDADGDTEFQVIVGAPSDWQATAEYRCIARDGNGSEVTSDTVRITVQ